MTATPPPPAGCPAPALPRETRRRCLIGAVPILLALLGAYWPAFGAGFIWDDDDYILENDLLVDPGGWAEIWNPSSPYNPQWYPMVFSTFRLERAVWGTESAAPYHVTNVLLHAANAVLLLFLLVRLRVPGAWFIALIFAVHPVHVESVVWVAERKNVLSGLFYLLAAHAWLTFDRAGRRRWFAVALAFFVAALLSKTITASLPVALGVILWWKGCRYTWPRLATLGVMLVIGFVFGMVTRHHEHLHVLTEGTVLDRLTPVDRLVVAGRVAWFYPAKIIWPVDLAFIYPRWAVSAAAWWQWLYLLGGLAVTAVLVGLWRAGRIGRGPLAAGLFYGATIFPALGFVDVAPMRFSFVADHFQYLASIGIIALVVGTVAAVAGPALAGRGARARRSAAVATGAAIALVLVPLTFRQAAIYEDLGTLWADTVAKNPTSSMVRTNYGAWLEARSEIDAAAEQFERLLEHVEPRTEGHLQGLANLAVVRLRQERPTEGLALADEALAIAPDHATALLARGRALYRLQRFDEAAVTLRRLLALQYDAGEGRARWDIRRRVRDERALLLLGNIQSRRGALAEAEDCFRRALAIDETYFIAQLHLGNVLLRQERLEEARAAYRRAIELDGSDVRPRRNLAMTCAALGAWEDAGRSAAAALALDAAEPTAHRIAVSGHVAAGRWPDAIAATRAALDRTARPEFRAKLALLLATAPPGQGRDAPAALALASVMHEQAGGGDPYVAQALAAALAAGGAYDRAAEVALAALPIATNAGVLPLAAQLRGQADAYASGATWTPPP